MTYLLQSPLAAVRDPEEALALLDQPHWRSQADTFEFNEVLATAYHKITAIAKPSIPCAKLST